MAGKKSKQQLFRRKISTNYMKKKVFFITKDSIWKKLAENNNSVDGRAEYLLGYNCLNEEKYEKSFSNLPRGEIKGLAGIFCNLLETPFRKITSIGIALEVYPLLKKEIKATDIIICVNDGIGLGLLFWKKLRLVKAEVIVMIMGLPERIKRFQHWPLINWFISLLLKKASVVMTLSDCAGASLKKYFQLEEKRVKTFHFGTNNDYWKPRPEIKKENFIISIGPDGNRDYQTLIKALPEKTFLKIVTKIPINLEKEGVEVISEFLTGEEIQKLYNQALFAVIPSKKLEVESAGLSSVLQLMASNVAVIVSFAPALGELFSDGENCLFYEPENPEDLRKKIDLLLHDKILRDKLIINAKRLVEEKFNCRKMAERLEKIIDNL
jgi:glycosyltransferase involved in cell wall biosynthesis